MSGLPADLYPDVPPGTALQGKSVVQTVIEAARDPHKVLEFGYACEALNNSFFLESLVCSWHTCRIACPDPRVPCQKPPTAPAKSNEAVLEVSQSSYYGPSKKGLVINSCHHSNGGDTRDRNCHAQGEQPLFIR